VVAGIESVLDTLIGRSILFEVKHVTDEPLRIEMDGDGHGAGGFSTPPPHQINPYEAVVFASRNTGDLHGSLRLVGANVWFGMSFSNPVVGSNQLRVKAVGKARPTKKKIDPERLIASAEQVLVQQPLLKKRPKQ